MLAGQELNRLSHFTSPKIPERKKNLENYI
jgi:hypothetical protein